MGPPGAPSEGTTRTTVNAAGDRVERRRGDPIGDALLKPVGSGSLTGKYVQVKVYRDGKAVQADPDFESTPPGFQSLIVKSMTALST